MDDTDEFDRAVVAFSETYADQTNLDHERFDVAIEDGTLQIAEDLRPSPTQMIPRWRSPQRDRLLGGT